jgi:hypothetical protein
MTKSGIFALVFTATVLAISFGARPASALVCCSVCDEDPLNKACLHGCSPSCVVDDEPVAPDHVVYDDAAKVCYSVAP